MRLKRLPAEAVPADLADYAELLAEFWASRKARDRPGLTRVCNKLRAWSLTIVLRSKARSTTGGTSSNLAAKPRPPLWRQWTDDQWSARRASLFCTPKCPF